MVVPRPVVLAAITGGHGVAGEVRLKLFGEGVESLRRFRAFTALRESSGETRRLSLEKLRSDGKGGAVARLAGVSDRNGAESLRGMVLTVTRDELPPLGEGEYYHADLLGLAATSDAGTPLGRVIAVENYGAGDVIEIETPPPEDAPTGSKPRRFMVPVRPAVIQWDDERIVISADFVED